MHRDIKPENILLTRIGVVKIADFGISRKISATLDSVNYTPNMVTIWYRAPEILIGEQYNQNVDIWSFGCIMAEFWTRQPIFQGQNQLEQIWKIVSQCGTIGLVCESWPEENYSRTWLNSLNFQRNTLFFTMSNSHHDEFNILFDKIMQCNPKLRPTARQLTAENFFETSPHQSALRSLLDSIII